MLELIEGLPGNIVGIAVSGRLTKQDCNDILAPAIAKSLRRHDKIRLYYELNSRFPGAAWDDIELGLEQASRCERVAIVTDIGWVRLTVKALRFLIPSEIRVFPSFQADEGRCWIRSRAETRTGVETAAPVRARRARTVRARHASRRDWISPGGVTAVNR
ncbi:MAG: STAS/SEC14 domain-containing protein [Alphaproteobacteria bacterium]|nr:STAS/SEC14 domain-containing protein [Alphaproteobacteria bacterium]MBV9198172.1 STAS/SEC14 domain-containing protein [Alphaproteobacteria bacterium]MBV9378787.1 STAS/SEC14 domain-containing protein [Alphaproteobacteria bacterium]